MKQKFTVDMKLPHVSGLTHSCVMINREQAILILVFCWPHWIFNSRCSEFEESTQAFFPRPYLFSNMINYLIWNMNRSVVCIAGTVYYSEAHGIALCVQLGAPFVVFFIVLCGLSFVFCSFSFSICIVFPSLTNSWISYGNRIGQHNA